MKVDVKYKNDNKKIIYPALMIALFLVIFIMVILAKNKSLQSKLDYYENEPILHECYLCDSEVEIRPVNFSYYIKCKKCDLKTTFFDSKRELIEYWNKGTTTFKENEDDL